MTKKQGFTLIELSIVLVIIGLIAGGIMLGRDLIATAKMRSTIDQLQQYRTAINTFRLKYNCIPGDCPNAVAFGLGTNGGPGDNGNGNDEVDSGVHPMPGSGRINGAYWTGDKEMANFWYHIQQAKLINSNLTGYSASFTQTSNYMPKLTQPENTYLTVFSLTYSDSNSARPGQRIMVMSKFDASLQYDMTFSVNQAYYIDSKLDDGMPGGGIIRSFRPYIVPQISNFSTDDTCSAFVGCTLNFCVNAGNAQPESNGYDLKGQWRWNMPYDGTNTYDQSGQYGNDIVECGLVMLNAF